MWTRKLIAILGLASVSSLAVGCVSGYTIAKRRLGKEFDLRLEKEMLEAKRLYSNLQKPDPEWLAGQLLDTEDLQPKHPYDKSSDDVPPEVLDRIVDRMREAEAEVAAEAMPMGDDEGHNAFDNPAPEWVQEDEELERRNGVPYIISSQEFDENQWEFEIGHLTYYEGDDTLADSRDEAIPEQFKYVGEKALDHFGFGSGDPNIVYVCNEQNEMVLEICRSNKSFAEDVLGFRHDADRRPRVVWDG